MDAVVETLHDPHLIGFVSFTRVARREASTRAADRFGMKPAELEEGGWFRTLHSVAYRCLGVGKELLAGSKADAEWLQESIQEPVDGLATGTDQDLADSFGGKKTDAGRALTIWDNARNRLESYETAWRRMDEIEDDTPSLDYCRRIVTRYEQAKRIDHRCDFTDLLTRFAGQYATIDGIEPCKPDGDPPDLPVWFLDETQDCSKLLHECQLRLIAQPSVRWVYVAADPFQSIFGFAGASPECFLHGFGPTAKRRTMPKSYRCPAPIMELGEQILRDCSDYFDRGIQPADHDGEIDFKRFEALAEIVDPKEEWLILARTNFLASQMAKRLDEADIPWLPTRGNGVWNAPVRNEAINACMNLQAGAPIDGREFQSILKYIPCKIPEGVLLEHGTKSSFEKKTPDEAQDEYPWMMPEELLGIGATPLLLDGIRTGSWRHWIDGADRYAIAVERHGQEAVDNPKIRVGTIHSAKGAEADNVALLTTISEPCFRSAQTDEGYDEETRCKYVGVTRAKRRLVILNEQRPKYRWKMDA